MYHHHNDQHHHRVSYLVSGQVEEDEDFVFVLGSQLKRPGGIDETDLEVVHLVDATLEALSHLVRL